MTLIALLYFLKLIPKDIHTDKDLQDRLQLLERWSDTVVIQPIYPEDNPIIKLTGEDLKKFFSLLKLEIPEEYGHCLCGGNLRFIFQNSGEELISVSYHHGGSIRNLLPIDTDLFIVPEYRNKLREFFKERNITFQ